MLGNNSSSEMKEDRMMPLCGELGDGRKKATYLLEPNFPKPTTS